MAETGNRETLRRNVCIQREQSRRNRSLAEDRENGFQADCSVGGVRTRDAIAHGHALAFRLPREKCAIRVFVRPVRPQPRISAELPGEAGASPPGQASKTAVTKYSAPHTSAGGSPRLRELDPVLDRESQGHGRPNGRITSTRLKNSPSKSQIRRAFPVRRSERKILPRRLF